MTHKIRSHDQKNSI